MNPVVQDEYKLLLQLMVVKLPFLQTLFGFADIPVLHFLMITILSTTVLWAGELYKVVRYRWLGYEVIE